MPTVKEQSLTVRVSDEDTVSGLLCRPAEAQACLVLAHGAGAGMRHTFMTGVAEGLAERKFATLRFQFPYMEQGRKRPDLPKLAWATVRAAVAEAVRRLPDLPLFAGGKSFGGRMTSQAQAESPMPAVRGLVFFGFPLHPAGNPSADRGEHLGRVMIPMLFLQGTRDALAEQGLLRSVVISLGTRATLRMFEDADHSFHVRASSGRTDVEVFKQLLNETAKWIQATVSG